MADAATGNWLAYSAILAWPLVAIALYSTRPFAEASAWTVLGALLLLPSHVSIKFAMIPAIDKTSMATISLLIGCALAAPRLRQLSASNKWISCLAVVYVLSPVATSLLNNDLVTVGPRVLPGVGYYDGISALLSQSILFLPFLVGRRFLTRAGDLETLLGVLVLCALIYSLPMIFEIKFSPQLSMWIYGTFSAATSVEMRYGGFRPVVFMINGLAAAFFLSTAILATAAFWRVRGRVVNLPSAGIFSFLGLLLILCKSAGALVYAVLFGTLIRWFRPKLQMRVAVVLAILAISYPLLRMSNLFPTERLLELSATFNKERASSLGVRFDQEQKLLAHAADRFWLGWGRYGRSRVYDEYGQDISITDGQWIVTLGQFGFIGFIAQFGLLTVPIFFAARTLKFVRSQREAVFLSCLTLIVALTAIEQIPNASISSWSWLIAGALVGRSSAMRVEAASARRAASGRLDSVANVRRPASALSSV
ncbi:hypothetical protein JQ594_07015 [Bradyrhizobium manausense]|uniref:O-antigen ligase family protein n=1 Tax=Bradyrhizobium manausense TaxID=989370 RepID=UPI001BAE3DD2|nr:hypothetical protein [Bradyrhizobium manausense]MBR0685661.1 hypothetical protein [Bradyrhizobium manausense]